MNQPSPELTTRDVLQQIDRRLELIEADQRHLSQKLGTQDDKFDGKFAALDVKFEGKFAAMDDKFESKFAAQEARADTRFRWTVGLILMSWMSTMGTILLRLGPPSP